MAARRSKRAKLDEVVHEVAPTGDMVVRVGASTDGGARMIRVHSLCLKLASPVFKIMLESSFAEGIASHTEETPLNLPEDRGPAFLEFCKILHHQQTRKPELALFPSLILLADKYQCIESVKPHFLMAFGPYFGPRTDKITEDLTFDSLNLTAIFCMAYIVGDAQLFHRVSRSVLRACTISEVTKDSEQFNDLLPPDLISRIVDYLLRLRCILRESLTQPESEAFEQTPTCEGPVKMIGYYRMHLYYKGVTKVAGWSERTLTCDWTDIEAVARLHAVPIPGMVDKKDVSCGKKCKRCPIDLKTVILDVVNQSKESIIPLCLMCESAPTPPELGQLCSHEFAK